MTIGVSIEVEMRLLCIPPGQSFGSGTFSIKRSPLKKKKKIPIRYFKFTIFSPKETVMF